MRSLILRYLLLVPVLLITAVMRAQPEATLLDCAVPLVETYCYGSSDEQTWTYSAPGEMIRLRFLIGTIETGVYDLLFIYDGLDANGPMLFQYYTPGWGTCNLGPEGSAVYTENGCYLGVDVFASSGSIHMVLLSDASIDCMSAANWDPWEWEVSCSNAVAGKIFLDTDLNCQYDDGEYVVPQVIVQVQPGPFYATTNWNGEFFMALDQGSYTITQLNPAVTDHCHPANQTFQVDADGNSPLILFPDTASSPLDLQVMMSSGAARLGFQYTQAISVRNLSAVMADQVVLQLDHAADLLYGSATPAPSAITANTLVWDIATIGPFAEQTYYVSYTVPVDAAFLGTHLISVATVNAGVDDTEQGNNSFTHQRTITAAIDPNDKLANTSDGNTTVWHIDNDEWIDYTIRFQNTGTDTAFNVLITDTLLADLDPSTMQIGAGSHSFTWELKGMGILAFHFANILLPDSNVNEPASHGFVGFRIRPRLPLLPGDEIENIANIYFDLNEPVITEPCVLVATMSTSVPASTIGTMPVVHPQPSTGMFWITGLEHGVALEHMRVFSNDGRLVHQQRITSDQRNFNLKGLARGQYVLEFLQRDGTPMRTKLILE